MDVFCAKEEELSLFHDMSHVVIGTVPPVTDKDISGPRRCDVAVDHATESPEFILLMDGLEEGVGISMLLQVIEGIQVHAVESFSRMPLGNKIFRRGKGWPAEKSKGGTIGSKEAERGRFPGRQERGTEVGENSFQCFGLEFCPLLIEGRSRWGIPVQTEEIKIYPGRGRAAGNQESQKLIRPKFSGADQILARMEGVLRDIGHNMVDSIKKAALIFSCDIKAP